MEDPWVNAWGDPHKSSSDNSTTWTSSSKFVTDDQADIAVPSWEPDTGTIWDDSPETHNNLWSRENRVSQVWATPTMDSIGFAKPSQEAPSELDPHSPPRVPSPQHREHHDPDMEDEKVSGTTAVHAINHIPETKGRPAIPGPVHKVALEVSRDNQEEKEVTPRVPSPDPDGFGTFEVAADDYTQQSAWTPSRPRFSQMEETGDWGTTWKESEEDVSNGDAGPVDEWELAKRQKEVQDHYVPPAFLESILRHFDEFSGEYWSGDQSEAETYGASHDGRNELAENLGIASMVDRLIPSDLTLSPPTAFTKTFISKEMVEALKLTRHHLIIRNSPLAVYINTKGSLSWEAAIKSKPDMTEADVVPAGWRILPKENVDQQQSANDTKRKAAGGLLSFFGRKSTTNAPASGSSSPIGSNTPAGVSPRSSTTSPRSSVDVNPITLVAAKSMPPPSPVKEVDATPSTTMSATAKTAISPASIETEEPVQTPSAVSRFFGRFSRSNRSSHSNSRNSIALSSDDLEFLSDIVPSANDEVDELDKLGALSNVGRTPVVPTKLPPPLAPPPRAPQLSKTLSPPPPAGAWPITPSVQGPSDASSISMQGPTQGQLFDLDSNILPSQPWSGSVSSQVIPASPFMISPPQNSAPAPSTLPPPLPPPLSPTPRSHTPTVKPPVTAPAPSLDSLFDNDDFSDFQTPLAATSAPLASMDSTFSSYTTSVPVQSLRNTQQTFSFDDFDDFASPPQVPEKSGSIPVQSRSPAPSTPPILSPPVPSIPTIPSIKSTSPPKQPSIHERRLSRQADSHQRALSLLETAAARGKWPAPPSPLPNAIPPPASRGTGSNLFDVFEETGAPAPDIAPAKPGSSLNSISNPTSPPTILVPPPSGMVMNGNANGGSLGNGPGFSGMRDTAPTIPPPLIPTHQTMKLVPPSQARSQTQQQWRTPSPPTAKPPHSFTRLPSSSFGFDNNGGTSRSGSRSGTPMLQPSPQRQEPATSMFPSIFTSTTTIVSQASGGSSQQNTGSSGGKLSAQDLSFFESL